MNTISLDSLDSTMMSRVNDFAKDYGLNLTEALNELLSRGLDFFKSRKSQDHLVITPELRAKIDQAHQDHLAGRCIKFDSAADAQKWLEAL